MSSTRTGSAAFLGPDITSDDQFAADLASTILGGGRSSRLYRKLREEDRLVYSVSSSFWSQRGTGVFAINAVFDIENEKKSVEGIINEINTLMKYGPTDEEMDRAKIMTKSQWYFNLETIHDRASTLGYWNLIGRPDLADTYIENIEKVTKDDIVAFFKKYYGPNNINQAELIYKSKNAK